jgi:endonuclease G, mitochondrial
MSSSKQVQLTVTSEDRAADIYVLDGQLNLAARGSGELTVSLSPGIYQVKARVGNAEFKQEEILEERPIEIRVPSLAFASAAPLADTAKIHEYQIASATAHSTTEQAQHGSGSSIYIFARDWTQPGDDAAHKSRTVNPAAGLKLCDLAGNVLVNLETAAVISSRADPDPWAACNITLDPGQYILSLDFVHGDGATTVLSDWSSVCSVQQIVVASPQWQTQVFLLQRMYEGVGRRADLNNAAVFVSAGSKGFQPNDRDTRLTELARLSLTSGRVSLSRGEMQELLSAKTTNPLLGIYAAHLTLLQRKRVERRKLERSSSSSPDSADWEQASLEPLISRLRELLVDPHPDVEALAVAAGLPITNQDFSVPPMLRRSWDMVCNATFNRTELIPGGTLAARIARNVYGDGQWLSWLKAKEKKTEQVARRRSLRSNLLYHRASEDHRHSYWQSSYADTLSADESGNLPKASMTLESTMADQPSGDTEGELERLVTFFNLPRSTIEEMLHESQLDLASADLEMRSVPEIEKAKVRPDDSRRLSTAERLRRLRALLKARSAFESVEPHGGSIADALAPESVDLQQKLRDQTGKIEPTDVDNLETIILKSARPTVLIRAASYEPLPLGRWEYLNAAPQRSRLASSIPAVGRIKLLDDPIVPYCGTGFVVGPRLLMTSRRVARLFSQGIGTRVRLQSARVVVEFQDKLDSESDTSELPRVTGVLMIHPVWDIAFLRIARLPESVLPLPLSVTSPGELVEQDVVEIGYPGRDYRVDPDLQDQIFEQKYGVKRLAPGVLLRRERIESFDTFVNALKYDSSTLGDNSGAALIHVASGEVIGLRCAGEYLKANYAVPMYKLARDERVVALGVNFVGRLPASNRWNKAWARADQRPRACSSAPMCMATATEAGSAAPMHERTKLSVAAGGSVDLPVQVSISLGMPIARASSTVRIRPGDRPEGLFGHNTPAIDWEQIARRFSRNSLALAGFDWRAALSLVLSSKLAYSTAAEIRDTAAQVWRLETCEFVDVDDTQCFVASTASAILVAFRGSESTGDWMANLNAFALARRYGTVHRGFYGQFLAVQSRLESLLRRLTGRPILVTGHSLGGALATIAAAEWQGRFPVDGVYTFGQPAVGRGAFQPFMARNYGARFFRFVNNNDIVPRVPPNFSHVGRLYHFDSAGNLASVNESLSDGLASEVAPMMTESEFDRMRASLLLERAARHEAVALDTPRLELEGLLPSISDHYIDNYVAKVDSNTDQRAPDVESAQFRAQKTAPAAPLSRQNRIVDYHWVSKWLGLNGKSEHTIEQTAVATMSPLDELHQAARARSPADEGELVGKSVVALRALQEASQDSDVGVMHSPRNQLAALLQSETESRLPIDTRLEFPFDKQDVSRGLQAVFAQAAVPRHPILRPPTDQPDAFPDTARIFVVGDFGTGLYGAPVTARTLLDRGEHFDLLLHLGDIYYSGQPNEVRRRFLDVWPQSAGSMSRTLNGNHDMYSGGHGYFDVALPAFQQASSYFAYQNASWLLLGIDTSSKEEDLDEEQAAWITRLVENAGSRRVILFSHHPLFSNFKDQGVNLLARLNALLSTASIFAWYWGHEHHCIIYDRHPSYGLHARCLGHGGMPYKRKDLRNWPVIQEVGNASWRRIASDLTPAGLCLDGPNEFIEGHEDKYGPHGYATLKFEGPRLTEEIHSPRGELLYSKYVD